MPTFIFYNSNGEKVNTQQGWQGNIKLFDDFAASNGKKALTEKEATLSAAETTQRANETAKDK